MTTKTRLNKLEAMEKASEPITHTICILYEEDCPDDPDYVIITKGKAAPKRMLRKAYEAENAELERTGQLIIIRYESKT